MTITTDSELINALGNNNSRQIFNKSTISNMVSSQTCSLWRATGAPGQGAIPGAAAACDHNLLGGVPFTQQTSPATSYIGQLEGAFGGIALNSLDIYDRIAHMGGLNATLTTSQTVGIDISSLLGTANIAARIGNSDYSELQWFLEWYTDTGATASNATINVTYDDGSSGNLNTVGVGGTVRAGRMIRLNDLVPTAGRKIRAVNTITLSASTGTAGSFGVTAAIYKCGLFAALANAKFTATWAETNLASVPNSACLWPVVLCGSTQTGVLTGIIKIIHG